MTQSPQMWKYLAVRLAVKCVAGRKCPQHWLSITRPTPPVVGRHCRLIWSGHCPSAPSEDAAQVPFFGHQPLPPGCKDVSLLGWSKRLLAATMYSREIDSGIIAWFRNRNHVHWHDVAIGRFTISCLSAVGPCFHCRWKNYLYMFPLEAELFFAHV